MNLFFTYINISSGYMSFWHSRDVFDVLVIVCVCRCGILILDTLHLSCVVLTCWDEIGFVSICFSHAWRLHSSLLYMDWESLLPVPCCLILLSFLSFTLTLLCSSDLFLHPDHVLLSFLLPMFQMIILYHLFLHLSLHLALGSLLASSCATGEFWCSYISCDPTVHCCIAE